MFHDPPPPTEFGLLIKQQLYFDRYTKILAPTLDPLRDSRVQMRMKVEEESKADISAVDADDNPTYVATGEQDVSPAP